MLPSLLVTLLLSGPAHAEETPSDPHRTLNELAKATDPDDVDRRRSYQMEVNLRTRYLSVPDNVMDLFFFDSDDEGANPFERPSIRAFGVGIEYVLKPTPANWILYVEYLGSLMNEGYFDDVEEPAAHDDGDWVRPDNFGMVVLGVNYGYETMLSRWLSLIGGGGLGIGVVTGQLTQWNPGTDPDILDTECGLETAAAYERVNHCSNDGAKDIPRVLPTGDMSASFRIHFAEQASLRIEGGFHNMLYTGVAVGAVF